MSNYKQSKYHQHPVLKQNLSKRTKQEKIGKNEEGKTPESC